MRYRSVPHGPIIDVEELLIRLRPVVLRRRQHAAQAQRTRVGFEIARRGGEVPCQPGNVGGGQSLRGGGERGRDGRQRWGGCVGQPGACPGGG